MKPEQVRNLCDRTYAEAYDEKFVHSVIDQIRTADGVKHLTEFLGLAQAKNPGVTFTEGSFTDPQSAWDAAWDVISCMWYAYGLVDSLTKSTSSSKTSAAG